MQNLCFSITKISFQGRCHSNSKFNLKMDPARCIYKKRTTCPHLLFPFAIPLLLFLFCYSHYEWRTSLFHIPYSIFHIPTAHFLLPILYCPIPTAHSALRTFYGPYLTAGLLLLNFYYPLATTHFLLPAARFLQLPPTAL